MPRVTIPDFEPDKDILIFEINGEEYSFCADNEVLAKIARDNKDLNDDDDVAQMEAIPRILLHGFKKRHPDMTIQTIKDWLDSPRRIKAISEALGEYMGNDDDDENLVVVSATS